jgi:hypothetical protein
MIDWNTSNVKPQINTADKWDIQNQNSIRVLVRVADEHGFCGCAFAVYHHNSETWGIEGYHGNCYKVTHWTSLNEPSTACFQPVDNRNKE